MLIDSGVQMILALCVIGKLPHSRINQVSWEAD